METTSAILLRKTKLTETSLIVTWLTAEHGLMKTVAKGARRPKSPFAGRLDLFFTCEIAVARSLRSDLHALREAAVRDSREGLRQSYNRTRTAAYFVELIELTTEADQPAPEAFDLLRRGFDYLATHEPSRRAVLHFENQLARLLGVLGENNAHVEPATAIARLAGHELPAARSQLLKSLRPAPEDDPPKGVPAGSPGPCRRERGRVTRSPRLCPSFKLPGRWDVYALLTVILSGLAVQGPIILASLLGVIVSLTRSKDAPTAFRWTLAASLGSLLICLAAPATQQLVLFYGQKNALPAARIGLLFSGLSFFWACLHAATVGLFLVGAYAGRGTTTPPPGPAPDSLPPSLPH